MTQRQALKSHMRVYLAALVMFVVGSLGGTLIYLLNTSDDDGTTPIIGNAKAYNDQLERIGGRSAVFADQFNRWLAGLWHGERLGITVVVLATISTLVLLWVARQMERDELYRTAQKVDKPQG
jgi:hypothetical protein